jgi:hypothetical protein
MLNTDLFLPPQLVTYRNIICPKGRWMTQEAAIIHLSLPSKQALTRLFNIGVHYIFKEVGLRVHAPDPFRGAFYFISKEEDKATPTISLVEWSKLCIVVVLLFYVIIVLLLSFANNVASGARLDYLLHGLLSPPLRAARRTDDSLD